MAQPVDRFHALPTEIRDHIYGSLIEIEQPTALVMPRLYDSYPGARLLRGCKTNRKLIVHTVDTKYNAVSKYFRAEYLGRLQAAALKLKVGKVICIVEDLHFDILMDNFLSKMTAAADLHPNNQTSIEVYLTFTKNFDENSVDLRLQTSSFGRWLQYRDGTAAQGRLRNLTYHAENTDNEMANPDLLRFVLVNYKTGLYFFMPSQELDAVVAVVKTYFETHVTLLQVMNATDEEPEPTARQMRGDEAGSETEDEDEDMDEGPGVAYRDMASEPSDVDSDEDPDFADGATTSALLARGVAAEETGYEGMAYVPRFGSYARSDYNMSSEEDFTDESLSESGL